MRRFFFNSNNLSDYSSANNLLTDNTDITEKACNNQPVVLSQLSVDSSITLTDDIYHHWCRVLRAKVGDQSLIFDGLGGQNIVELEAIDKKSAQARIVAHDDIDNSNAVLRSFILLCCII